MGVKKTGWVSRTALTYIASGHMFRRLLGAISSVNVFGMNILKDSDLS
jgi:hypothetical protein